MASFYETVNARRSNYALGNRELVSMQHITRILEQALQVSPSAFNNQPGRMIALHGDHHKKLWDIVWEILQKTAPPENLKNTKAKLDSFAAAAGTILFFIDDKVVEEYAGNFPLYADKFPVWAEESIGILQYVVWCSLNTEGYGVNLQHYNPLIDDDVRSSWNVPAGWRLVGQMVFGSPEAPPAAKNSIDPAGKVIVFE